MRVRGLIVQLMMPPPTPHAPFVVFLPLLLPERPTPCLHIVCPRLEPSFRSYTDIPHNVYLNDYILTLSDVSYSTCCSRDYSGLYSVTTYYIYKALDAARGRFVIAQFPER